MNAEQEAELGEIFLKRKKEYLPVFKELSTGKINS